MQNPPGRFRDEKRCTRAHQGNKQDRKDENDNTEEDLRTVGEHVESIKIKLHFTCFHFQIKYQNKVLAFKTELTMSPAILIHRLQTTPQDKLFNYSSKVIPSSGISALPSYSPSPFPGVKQSPDTT